LRLLIITKCDLIAFESQLNLSAAETVALFGLAERTVRAHRTAKELPHRECREFQPAQ